MVNVSFYITDVNYENREDKAVVQLFGRTIDGKKICVLTDYDYSFYVIPKKNIKKVVENVKKIVVGGKEKTDFVKNVEIIDMKYLGDDVQAIRVFISNPNAVREIAERIKDLDNVELVKETDLNFYKKYLLDNQITPLVLTDIEGEVLFDRDDLDVDFVVKAKKIKQVKEESFENPSIIAFDLEIYSPEKKYPSEKDPIIMLSMVSNDGYQKVFTWKKFKHNKKYIEFVEDEESLIHKFKEVLKEKNPDYITGYFSDGFDFPFLYARAKKYGIDLRFNNSNLRINKRGNSVTAKLKGIVHLDVFKFISGIMADSLNFENYKLNTVAKELLGKKKLDVNLDELGIVWDDGSDKLLEFCEYNLIDSQLTLELCEKILPNLNELVKLTNSPIYDICRLSYSAIVDRYLMRMAKEYNEIIPNKPDQGDVSLRRTHTYQGAFVYEPKPGLYGNLAVLDFRSLYPTILVVHNVCPTTLTNKKGGYESPEIVLESGEKKKYYFTSKKEGFIPRVVKEILTRRIRVAELLKKDKKNPILKARSYALKTVANATSGYLGFFGARWYCRECAESMTAWGREYITDVIKKAEKKGFEVIYGDSVGGDTKVIIKEKEVVREACIKDLFEKKDFDSISKKEYNFKKNLEVLTIDEKGNSVFKPLVYVMRHKCKKKMYRIHFTNKWHLDVTEDHSLMGYESLAFNKKEKNPLKRIIELKPGDIKKKANSLICLKKIPFECSPKFNVHSKVFEFMGYFIGDGSFVRNKQHQKYDKDYYLRLSFGLDKEELFEKLIKPLIKLGYIKSYWWSKTRKGDITINGLKLVNFISEHCRENNKKVIPSWLFDESEENISSFLRGLFSADGSVMIRNNAPIIKYNSIDENYINNIRKLLYRVGVSHSVFEETNPNTYKTKNKTYSTGSFSKHVLIKNKLGFIEKIGFLLERKNKRACIKTNSLQKKNIKNFEFDLQSVKKVELIKTPKYVYDLEVEDTHTFFANYILAHNTDSIFIVLGDKSKKDTLDFLDEVNRELPSLMELELDDFYKRGLFVFRKGEKTGAKKKYALVSEKGEIKVTGFETVRGDWSVIAREVQKKVLEYILKDNDPKKAYEYVRKVIEKIKSGKEDMEKMIIKTQLKRKLEGYAVEGPHVKVARKMKAKGEYVGPGITVQYIVTPGKGNIGNRAEIPEDAKSYDADYYINNQILPVVEKIFDVLGRGKEELVGGKKQMKLGEY